jgi:hypothetical protein
VSSSQTLLGFFGDRRRGPVQDDVPLLPELTPEQLALVAEGCTKSGVVWVRPQGAPTWSAAWHVWHEGAVHVVHGVGEQLLPVAEGPVELAVRSKDAGSRLLTVLAQADVLPARSPEWDAAADALSAARLNATEPAEQRERWSTGTLIVRLVPVRVLAAGAGTDATGSQAQPPPRGPATTVGRLPWHAGGRAARGAGTEA